MPSSPGPATAPVPPVAAVFAVGGAIASSLLLSLAVSTSPSQSDRFLAVFPPWWSAGRTLGAAAGAGELAAVGGWPFLVTLHSDRPGLASRLRDAGALFLLDPRLAGVCATPQPNSHASRTGP